MMNPMENMSTDPSRGVRSTKRLREEGLENQGALSVPDIFSYLDFRKYLNDFYSFKKETSPGFSLATFSKKAGIATRNYLKRVIDGERPLSSEAIPKFCIGLGLSAKEKIYFEALVNFNQSKDSESKKHYFSSLCQITKNMPSSVMGIAKDQFEVYNHWYILPIRELVLLDDFQEDAGYVSRKLKNKISKKEAAEALEVLIRLGLLIRNSKSHKLEQADPVIRYDAGVVNMAVREFHLQTIDRTKEALSEDTFDSWDVQTLSLAVPSSQVGAIQNEIKTFIHQLNVKYSNTKTSEASSSLKRTRDTVLLINTQAVEITKKGG